LTWDLSVGRISWDLSLPRISALGRGNIDSY
jgi:hypothetical protein